MVNAANFDPTGGRVMGDTPPSSEAVDFADTIASVKAGQNSGAPIQLAQAATPTMPGAGPFPVVPGITPGSFENGEWTKHTIDGHVGLFKWIGSLLQQHGPPPAAPVYDDAGLRVSPRAMNMKPPGDCTPKESGDLQDNVNNLCKRPRACFTDMSLAEMQQMSERNRECAQARDRVNKICYAGGDLNHRNEAIRAWRSLADCESMISKTFPFH